MRALWDDSERPTPKTLAVRANFTRSCAFAGELAAAGFWVGRNRHGHTGLTALGVDAVRAFPTRPAVARARADTTDTSTLVAVGAAVVVIFVVLAARDRTKQARGRRPRAAAGV